MTRKQMHLKILPSQIFVVIAFILAIFKVIHPITCIIAQMILFGFMIVELFSIKNEKENQKAKIRNIN